MPALLKPTGGGEAGGSKGDLTLAVVPAGGGGAGGGRKARGGEKDPKKYKKEDGTKKQAGNIQGENKKLLVLIMKMLMQSAQRGRDADSVVFDFLLGPGDSKEVLAMTEQNTLYQENTKGKKGHDLGPPHIWTFGGLLSELVKKGPGVGLRTAGQLTECMDKYEAMGWEEKCDFVKFCRVSKVYKEDQRRLVISFGQEGGPARGPILQALQETGWVRKHGRAPPGYMEREVQEWLELLTG